MEELVGTLTSSVSIDWTTGLVDVFDGSQSSMR